METETRTIGEWYRVNKQAVDAWIELQKLGSFYELPLEKKRAIYNYIHRTEEIH